MKGTTNLITVYSLMVCSSDTYANPNINLSNQKLSDIAILVGKYCVQLM